MKFDNQLRYAVQIVDSFDGVIPLHGWLKNFFRQHKQMGSGDRKLLSTLVHGYYRLGHALREMPVSEKIIIAFFLCSKKPNAFLEHFNPAWNDKISTSLQEKFETAAHAELPGGIFPWKDALSNDIDPVKFCESFLVQPDLFLRLRPGQDKSVMHKLDLAGIDFSTPAAHCLALNNATKLDEIIGIDEEAVVQDYSSQQTGDYFNLPQRGADDSFSAWDCCAASGGKSIMLYDRHPGIKLTVSDIRESILINLKKRFQRAGIEKYNSFITDLSTQVASPAKQKQPADKVDLVIADLPCSGSGTWGRTPDALCFFQEAAIPRYAGLQKKILSNVVPILKKGGRLVYITCSVFKEENEEVVAFIRQNYPLRFERMELIKGYTCKADTMFVASLVNDAG